MAVAGLAGAAGTASPFEPSDTHRLLKETNGC